MTTQFFKRPSANYAGEAGLPNRTKYYTDSTSSPKVPISSTKVDGDINYLIDAVNALYDTAVSGVVGDGSITNVKLRDSGACSVIGRAANSSGTPADISAATNGTVLVRKSNQVQFSTIPAGAFETGAIATSDLADTAVSFGKIQNVSTGVVLGRSSSGAGPVEALTAGTGLTISAGAISVPDASTTVKGVVELATDAEVATGTSTALTPTVSQLSWCFISAQTASNSASLAFTGLASTYSAYVFELVDLRPATDDVGLDVVLSTDNGSSYLSSNYQWQAQCAVAGSGVASEGSASASNIRITRSGGGSAGVGNAATESYAGVVTLQNPASTSAAKKLTAEGAYYNAAGTLVYAPAVGSNNTASAVNAIRFAFSSGNITSGVIRMYGLR